MEGKQKRPIPKVVTIVDYYLTIYQSLVNNVSIRVLLVIYFNHFSILFLLFVQFINIRFGISFFALQLVVLTIDC